MAALNWPVGKKSVLEHFFVGHQKKKGNIIYDRGVLSEMKHFLFKAKPKVENYLESAVISVLAVIIKLLFSDPPPSHRLLNLNGPPNAEGGDYTVFLTLRPPPPAGSSSARPDLDWSDVIINRKTASSWSRYHHLRLSINLIKTLIWFISMTLFSKLPLFVDTAPLGGFHLINPLSHRSMDAKIRFLIWLEFAFYFNQVYVG